MTFNGRPVSLDSFTEYRGSEVKRGIILEDGTKCMLKLPDPIREKGHDLSYINNAISEYIGCHIFESVRIPAQKTMLGEYVGADGRTKIACACQDLRSQGEQLFEISQCSLYSSDDEKNPSITMRFMDGLFERMDGIVPKEELSRFYYDMFIVDALIGNTDRHNGNWGIIVSNNGARISPVYDCGSSFAPLLEDSSLSEKSAAMMAMNANSVLCDDDGRRIRYCDFFSKKADYKIADALSRVMPRIDLDKIDTIIDDTPYISDERRTFYKTMAHTSYERILLPAFEKTLAINVPTHEFSAEECAKFYRSVIAPMKSIATYQKQNCFGNELDGFQFTKAGRNHLIIYNNNIPVAVLSTHSKNDDVRESIAKLESIGGYQPEMPSQQRNDDISEEEYGRDYEYNEQYEAWLESQYDEEL